MKTRKTTKKDANKQAKTNAQVETEMPFTTHDLALQLLDNAAAPITVTHVVNHPGLEVTIIVHVPRP